MPRHAYYHQLPPPTPEQAACRWHRLDVTHTLDVASYANGPWPDWPYPRRRYVRCRKCGLRARTTERLDLPRPMKRPRRIDDPSLYITSESAVVPQARGTASTLMQVIEETIAEYMRHYVLTRNDILRALTQAWWRQVQQRQGD